MKKFKALLMALVCLTCMAFTLTACGQTPPPEDPTTEQYTVTFTSEDAVKGSVSAKTSSATTINSGDKVDAGTQITFTATANTGYSFDGWYCGDEKWIQFGNKMCRCHDFHNWKQICTQMCW